jgi:hypothetical protein
MRYDAGTCPDGFFQMHINIMSDHGRRSVKANVLDIRPIRVAYHRGLGGGWAVTHIQTGRMLAYVKGPGTAEKMCREIAELLPVDGDIGDAPQLTPEQLTAIRAVITKYSITLPRKD